MSTRAGGLPSFLIVAIALFGGACATDSGTRHYAPITPEQARVFEHGVDFVAGLEGLEGKWRVDWERDLEERVRSADLVAIVNFHTERTDTDPSQRVTHRLLGRVEREIMGEAEDEIELTVREDEAGFPTVHDNLARLTNRPFVLYAKWYRDDSGARAAHWHLSPASEAIMMATEAQVAEQPGSTSGAETSTERVVVHTN